MVIFYFLHFNIDYLVFLTGIINNTPGPVGLFQECGPYSARTGDHRHDQRGNLKGLSYLL